MAVRDDVRTDVEKLIDSCLDQHMIVDPRAREAVSKMLSEMYLIGMQDGLGSAKKMIIEMIENVK